MATLGPIINNGGTVSRKVTLDTADITGMSATTIIMFEAPGAGKSWHVISYFTRYFFNSIAFNDVDFTIGYSGVSVFDLQISNPSGFINQTSDQQRGAQTSGSPSGEDIRNVALLVTTNGDPGTSGDGSAEITITCILQDNN